MTLVWAPITRDVVTVTGPDAATYLQGQLSQDIEALGEGESAPASRRASGWTFVLQPTGKVDAFARVRREGADRFALDTDAGAGEALLARLQRFKLRTKAELGLDTDVPGIAVRGDGAPPGLVGWWAAPDAVDMLGADAAPPAGAERIDADALERLRIEAGWPAMGAELTPDTIPGESGVVTLAVSFTKGCYTGQELVARIDSRGGNVPRHLRRLRTAAGGSIGVADRLVAGGKDVGWVTSSVGDVALGYVARAVEPPATLTAGTTTAAVEVIQPPA